MDQNYIKIDQNGKVVCTLKCDFIVYLDKDKYLSSLLEKCGFRLFNSHNTIRLCDDKGETHIALANSGIKMPKTLFPPLCYSQNADYLQSFIEYAESELNYPIIVKESFGSMAQGVFVAETQEELKEIAKKLKLKPHLFQQYMSKKVGVDVRVIVIGGKVVASMERVNENDFRSNIAVGGKGKKIELNGQFTALAEKCAKVINVDYCGVDILYGDNCEPVICEINSNAFYDGIEKVTGVNIAKAYAEYIISKIN